MAVRYGLDIVSKRDPKVRAIEWYEGRKQRDEYRTYYMRHGRTVFGVEESFVSREERAHELAVARASRPSNANFHGYGSPNGGSGMSVALALAAGVALGGLF